LPEGSSPVEFTWRGALSKQLDHIFREKLEILVKDAWAISLTIKVVLRNLLGHFLSLSQRKLSCLSLPENISDNPPLIYKLCEVFGFNFFKIRSLNFKKSHP
jgi:hypothetical protein